MAVDFWCCGGWVWIWVCSFFIRNFFYVGIVIVIKFTKMHF